MTVLVTVTSDYVCPWCHIGLRKLRLAIGRLPGLAVQVAYRPFELNPDFPQDGIERRQYRIAKFGSWERSQALDAQVAAAGAEVGLAFDFGRIARTPNTGRAHRLTWAAGKAGADTHDLAGRLFAAYFSEGRDIGATDVLRDIAAACGVPADAAGPVLDGEAGQAEVRAMVDGAYRRGIQGVPFFEIGGKAVSGAQPVELFESFLKWGAGQQAAAA